jgi:hypothetical protein
MKPKTFPREMLSAFVISAGGVSKVRFDESRCTFQFAIPALRLAVENESGNFGQKINWMKLNRAQILGWKYLRFTDHEIRAGISQKMIGEFIENKVKGGGG